MGTGSASKASKSKTASAKKGTSKAGSTSRTTKVCAPIRDLILSVCLTVRRAVFEAHLSLPHCCTRKPHLILLWPWANLSHAILSCAFAMLLNSRTL